MIIIYICMLYSQLTVTGRDGPVGQDVLSVVVVEKGQERNHAPIQRLRMAVKYVEAVVERNKHAARTTVQVRFR